MTTTITTPANTQDSSKISKSSSRKTIIKIEDIKIGNRVRKDLGDIDGLVQSIKDVGLLQPICVNEDTKELVDGGRRIEAYKKLGRSEIPVYLIPIKDILEGQLSANVVRKDFTVEEQVKITEAIESKRIGHRTKKGSNLEPFQSSNKGKKTVEIASQYIGISPAQLSKTKEVYLYAKNFPDKFGYLISMIDNKEITVHEATKRIERHYREERELKEEAEAKKHREEQKQKREQLKKQMMQPQPATTTNCTSTTAEEDPNDTPFKPELTEEQKNNPNNLFYAQKRINDRDLLLTKLIEDLSGMNESEIRQFARSLPRGKMYNYELVEHSKKNIQKLVYQIINISKTVEGCNMSLIIWQTARHLLLEIERQLYDAIEELKNKDKDSTKEDMLKP